MTTENNHPQHTTPDDDDFRQPAPNPAQKAPMYLDEDELANPMLVIKAVFDNRHLHQHREVLWDIQCAALASDLADLLGARETASWVQYFRLLEKLLEAVWLMHPSYKDSEKNRCR